MSGGKMAKVRRLSTAFILNVPMKEDSRKEKGS